MTVGQITDVINDGELPQIPLDSSVMVNLARVFDNFQDKANFIKQESGLVDIKHHKDYHVTDNFHGTAVLIRRFDPLKAGEVLKLHNEFYSGLTFLDRHYLKCSYLYNTHGCRSHHLLFMMNRYFEQHSVIAYSDQDQ